MPEIENDERMPITAHLEELRKRLLRSVIAIGVTFSLCFNYSEDILRWMMLPLNMTLNVKRAFPFFYATYAETAIKLTFTEITEPFWIHMKISFVAGIFLALPYLLLQVWGFISPGLLPKERRYMLPFIVSATAMFVTGALFCQYIVLPMGVKFLLEYKTENLVQMIKIDNYTDFVSKFMLAFGLIFELPLAIAILSKLGIVSPAFLSRNRKYAVLIAFIVAALLTPTSDVFNMTLMAMPILVLYEVGIILARILGKKKDEGAKDISL